MLCVLLEISLWMTTFRSDAVYWDSWSSTSFMVNVSILFGTILTCSRYFSGFPPSLPTEKKGAKDADVGSLFAKSPCTGGASAVKHLGMDSQSFRILEVKL